MLKGTLPIQLSLTIGSWLYFLPIVLLFLLYIPLRFLCKRKGQNFTYRFVLIMFWCNFALHFLKQFLPGYFEKLPEGLFTSSVQNFCALYIVAAPFLLMSKKKVLYDYLFYMGVLSSLGAFFYPSNPMAEDLGTAKGIAETIRYYACHAPLLYGGCLLMATKIHKLDYRRYFWTPLLIWVALGITFINSVVMNIPFHNYDWADTFSRTNIYVNGSIAVGPGTNLDPVLGWVYPYLFNYLQIYYVDGEIHFTPVLWLLLPLLLGGVILFPVLCLPFEYKHIREDRRKRLAIEEGVSRG